jgi:hypothetical protein
MVMDRLRGLRRINQDAIHQVNAAIGKARKEREKFRLYPSSNERTLHFAVDKAGFKILEKEFELGNLFFDVVIDISGGVALVDVLGLPTVKNKARDKRKEELCRSLGIPLLQLKRGLSLQEMYVRVWVWASNLATSAARPKALSSIATETSMT